VTPREPANPQYLAATTASHSEIPTPDRLLESALAFRRSVVLLSAHELGLFAELSAGPCDAGTLERHLGLLPDVTADFLDALVGLGLVERCGGHFRNTAEANIFLDPANPSYIGRWLAMASAAMRESADLTSRLRATSPNGEGLPDRMWADIADILGVAGARDDA
jgi:hypothetical protein